MPRKRLRIGWSVVVGAICIIPCVLTALLWLRSYWISDSFGFSKLSSISTDRGEFLVSMAEPDWNFSADRGYHNGQLPDPEEFWNPRRVAKQTWNVFFAHGERFPGLHIIVIRFWALFIIAASPLPIVLLPIVFRRHKGAG